MFLRRHFLWCSTAAAALVILVPGALAQAPHDARQGEQWAVADGAVLNLPAAWELSQGAGVVVAVIDSGARLEHPDLARNIWVNFDEVPGNRVDDDANGYVDDVHGAYPARTELGFVTRGAPKGRIARFIRWVRRSAKARRVIATRYVPLRSKPCSTAGRQGSRSPAC